METSLHKSESTGDEESCGEEIVLQVGTGKGAQDDEGKNQTMNCNNQGATMTKVERSSPDQSESRSSSSAKREQKDNIEKLESAKAEMDEVMEENQRLKMYLDRILKDYRNLEVRYREAIEQEGKRGHDHDHDELIDLSLGISSSDGIKTTRNNGHVEGGDKQGSLTLGLDCKFEEPKKLLLVEVSPNPSPENSVEEVKDDVAGETWPPKAMKNARDGGDEDVSQQNPTKRARVSVRVRCDTPTMNDGCQWRKYGQKIAKGNPCPRAYYRCTVAQSCPVRKQVQRCAEDMSVLITTYEGTHNHPLPISATAMASTTSAAAAMLISGSSTSTTGPNSISTTPATTTNLNGMNFYLSDNARSKPFYLPNSSISSNPSYPTITLDLTSSSSSSSSSSHLARLNNFPPRYSTTNLNFSSLESNPLPISWSNGVLTYGAQPLMNKNQTTSSLTFGPQSHENIYQSYLQKAIPNPNQQSLPSDTIAAATKAITSDPNFQSALAAALTSIIGSNNSTPTTFGNQNVGEKTSQINTSKPSEPFPILSSFPSTSNTNKCAPSFLNRTSSSSSTSSKPSGLTFLSPPFPFSNPKNKSSSPRDNRDH